jgi:hypothetical protein
MKWNDFLKLFLWMSFSIVMFGFGMRFGFHKGISDWKAINTYERQQIIEEYGPMGETRMWFIQAQQDLQKRNGTYADPNDNWQWPFN